MIRVHVIYDVTDSLTISHPPCLARGQFAIVNVVDDIAELVYFWLGIIAYYGYCRNNHIDIVGPESIRRNHSAFKN